MIATTLFAGKSFNQASHAGHNAPRFPDQDIIHGFVTENTSIKIRFKQSYFLAQRFHSRPVPVRTTPWPFYRNNTPRVNHRSRNSRK